MRIDSSEVSVIVQGPIVAETADCLRSIRASFPNSEIILSTWKGSDVSALNYDILELNDDPGGMLVNFRPDPARLNNVNRMIRSTRVGLFRATRGFSLKTRTDVRFQSAKLLERRRELQVRSDRYRLFNEPVIASSRYTRNPKREFPYPFHVSDMVQFGRTVDLRKLWDIPEEAHEDFRWFEDHGRPVPDVDTETDQRYAPEQYVFIAALQKAGFDVACQHQFDLTSETLAQHELALANNFIICEPDQMGYEWRQNEIAIHDWHSIYGVTEYARMQNAVLGKSALRVPDLELIQKTLHYEWFGRSQRSVDRRNRIIHTKNHVLAQLDRVFVRAPKKILKILFRK